MKSACRQGRGVLWALLLCGGLAACDDPVKPQGKGVTPQAGASLATDRRAGVFGNDVDSREARGRLNGTAPGALASAPGGQAAASAAPAVDYRLTER